MRPFPVALGLAGFATGAAVGLRTPRRPRRITAAGARGESWEEARARLASIVDSSEDAIIATSIDRVVLAWNEGATRMYGWKAREMVGEPLARIFPGDKCAEVEDLLRRILRHERVPPRDLVCTHRDGRRIDVALTLSPILDPGARITGLSLIARDITDRLASEQALRRSEERYRNLFEQASDGIFVADRTARRILDVNEAICGLLGVPRAELIGEALERFLAPEQRGRFRAVRRILVRRGGVHVGEWVLRRVDGESLPVEVSAKILPDGRWQGFARDIRQRKAAEAELARSRERETQARAWLQGVIERMPGGVILYDALGKVASYNVTALDYAVDETGKYDPFGNPMVFDIRYPSGEDVAMEDMPVVRAFHGDPVHAMELRIRKRDGREATVLFDAVPTPGGGSVAVFQDISRLKELERLREQWTAIVAHDLRHPVGLLRVSADLIESALCPRPEDRAAKGLERIRMAANQLQRMVNDLVAMSRIEARQLGLEMREVTLRTLVAEVVDRVRPVYGEQPVDIVIDESIPASFRCDPGRVEQILTNLLSNAFRHGPPGAAIRVEARRLEERLVEIRVANRGPEIPQEIRNRLFNRYQHAGLGRDSMGLGLFIARGLVEAHGGAIRVESANNWNVFSFTLPDATG